MICVFSYQLLATSLEHLSCKESVQNQAECIEISALVNVSASISLLWRSIMKAGQTILLRCFDCSQPFEIGVRLRSGCFDIDKWPILKEVKSVSICYGVALESESR